MKKNGMIFLVLIIVSFFLISCSKVEKVKDLSNLTFEEISELAKGTTVRFYGWGGDENINNWIDNVVAKQIKEDYEIKLERIPMVPSGYIPKLLNEKQVDGAGTIDIVWINGENFFNAKENGLLYGPFTEKLPNFNKYIDTKSDDNNYDFGHAIDGFEAPYGKAQMVYIVDSEKINEMPSDTSKLLDVAKNNPGKITYPDLSDFNGSAFVRNVIYDIVGYEVFLNLDADKEQIRKIIKPAMDYLNEIKPYLWRNGQTYPATVAQLDNMFSDGEVFMTMNYTPFHVATKIAEGSFAESSKSFVFEKGSIGNTHFLAIPFNSPNKAAAMTVINHILLPSVQASKFKPSVWGDLPVIDPTKLNLEETEIFNNIKLGKGVLTYKELLSKRVPEMRAKLVPLIEEIWREEVLYEK